MNVIATRAAELGLTLPVPSTAKGSYTPLQLIGQRFATSGVLPLTEDGLMCASQNPDNTQWLASAARQATLNILALINDRLANARDIHIDHLRGFVAASSTFTEGHLVMNAASDLLVELLGSAGVHTREAVHVASLPLGAAVEISVTGRWA